MAKRAMLLEETTGEVVEIPVEEVSKEWYRRPANFKLGQFDKDIEKGGGVSLTVPDQSYTVREILEKFTRGIPLDVQVEGSYDNPEENEMESFENAIDITDVENQLALAQKEIDLKKSQVEKLKAAQVAEAENDAKQKVEAEAKKAAEV